MNKMSYIQATKTLLWKPGSHFIYFSWANSQSRPSYNPSPLVAHAAWMYQLRLWREWRPSLSVISAAFIALKSSYMEKEWKWSRKQWRENTKNLGHAQKTGRRHVLSQAKAQMATTPCTSNTQRLSKNNPHLSSFNLIPQCETCTQAINSRMVRLAIVLTIGEPGGAFLEDILFLFIYLFFKVRQASKQTGER